MTGRTAIDVDPSIMRPFEKILEDEKIATDKKEKVFRDAIENYKVNSAAYGVKKIKIIKAGIISNKHAETLKRIKKAISHIDFGCNFKNGKCIANRRKEKSKEPLSKTDIIGHENGCCRKCAENIGFFTEIHENDVRRISKEWDNKNGFLGPNGCRLKLDLRSNTCSSWRCTDSLVETSLTHMERDILQSIMS